MLGLESGRDGGELGVGWGGGRRDGQCVEDC